LPNWDYDEIMTLKRLFLLSLVVVFLKGTLCAQETRAPQETSLFTPFVSRLQGEIKNNLLRLSWSDSPDARGPVYIYRSSAPFEEGMGLEDPKRSVEVPYGVESYIDEIEEPGTLYYFVAASDDRGRRFILPIPFNNSITVRISASPGGLAVSTGSLQGGNYSTPPGITPDPEAAELKASALEAFVEGDGVIITFSAGDSTQKMVLYRSVQPLRQTSDLVGAVIVQSGAVSPFTDYPVPGIPYYYAVISEEDLTKGTIRIFPGRNATVKPAEIRADSPAGIFGQDMRAMPLPLVSLAAAVPGMNAFTETPVQMELSFEAARALENLPAPKKKPGPGRRPQTLDRDLEEPSTGGEDYLLRSIVGNSFASGEWETCRDELLRFLSLPRSGGSEARARFYLGQCSYFLSRHREGLFEFLSAQPAYPVETAEWIQASLYMLTE
jgi:hypothetical protein